MVKKITDNKIEKLGTYTQLSSKFYWQVFRFFQYISSETF